MWRKNCFAPLNAKQNLSSFQLFAIRIRIAKRLERSSDAASCLGVNGVMKVSRSRWKISNMNVRFLNVSVSFTTCLISALFGIPRKCPKDPLAESFWDVKQCDQDKDCDFPRICCPNGRKRYCMNSYTEPEELPVGRQIAYPVESISQYFQCTPPPPTAFDSHPKQCNSSLTCFPNICCLEGGRKHCRPPKRNILAALTTFGQSFTWLRSFTDNLVIKR